MTPDRFSELAGTYGADLLRWPEAERTAAAALAAQRQPQVMAALAEAAGLDALLASHAVPGPSMALLQRVEDSASDARAVPRQAAGMPGWGARAALWWSGVAGVGMAGAAAGAFAVSILLGAAPSDEPTGLLGGFNAFGASSPWSEE